MYKNLLTTGLFAALLLGNSPAGAETWQPPPFDPPPVFEDEGLVGKRGGPQPVPVPAAQPEPAVTRVVPADPSPPAVTPGEPAAAPVSEPPPLPPPPAAATRPEPQGEESVAPGSASVLPELLAENYPVGLILLALAGLVFRSAGASRSGRRATRPSPPAAPAGIPPQTGVARYIASLDTRKGGA